jgi:diguanylate cyclase (GGDEF)-like protein/PAS domain S-box-containing protein
MSLGLLCGLTLLIGAAPGMARASLGPSGADSSLLVLAVLSLATAASALAVVLLVSDLRSRRSARSEAVARDFSAKRIWALLTGLLSGLDDLVLVVDCGCVIRLFSQSTSLRSIIDLSDPVGRRLDAVGIPDSLITEVGPKVTALLAGEGSEAEMFRLRLPPDRRELRVRCILLRDDHREILGVAILARDETHRGECAQARLTGLDRQLAALAVGLIKTASVDLGRWAQSALAEVGVRLGADRAYQILIDVDTGQMRQTEAWTAPGVAPAFEPYAPISLSERPWWIKDLRGGRSVRVPRVDALPDRWAEERETLMAEGIQSVMLLPLIHSGKLFGLVGFEAVRAVQDWSEEVAEGLLILAEALVGAHRRLGRDEVDVSEALRHREAINDVQEIVFRADADGRWTFLNPAWERVTGFPVAMALGRQSLDFVHPDDRRRGLVPFASLLRGESEHLRHEVRCATRQGGERWLEVNARLRRNTQGKTAEVYGTLVDITERKVAEEEIRRLAFYDPLTSLPNRRLLMDRLHQALADSSRNRRHGALFFIDLDNFKGLNDTRGHHMGDLLLQQVAGRLVTCVRENDTVARLGGDEFVVLLGQLSSESEEAVAQVRAAGEKIRSTLGAPYGLGNESYCSTPSIGATLFFGHDCSLDELLKRADIAMYAAKAAGRNAFRLFDPAMQASQNGAAHKPADFAVAIERGELHLFYQPQLDRHNRVMGAEALLRWRQPGRGTVAAAELIPQAIKAGTILTVGRWVLEEACAQLASWSTDPACAHLTLAVNVSVQQLRQVDFVAWLLSTLKATGADPRRLRLDVNEDVFLDDVDAIASTLGALNRLGIGIALDDFGSEHGSVRRLQRLPIDQLKIDRRFVQGLDSDPENAAVARAIIALGKALGLTVMAEGVERIEQHQYLLQLGCLTFQGYLFSRPVSRGVLKTRLHMLCHPDGSSNDHGASRATPDHDMSPRP